MLYVEIYKNHELNRLSNCGILEILRNFLEMIEKLSTNNIYKEICKSGGLDQSYEIRRIDDETKFMSISIHNC